MGEGGVGRLCSKPSTPLCGSRENSRYSTHTSLPSTSSIIYSDAVLARSLMDWLSAGVLLCLGVKSLSLCCGYNYGT